MLILDQLIAKVVNFLEYVEWKAIFFRLENYLKLFTRTHFDLLLATLEREEFRQTFLIEGLNYLLDLLWIFALKFPFLFLVQD